MTDPRARLQALGLRPSKHLSQSFLHDESTAAAIVRAATLTRDEHVLEVGPGTGALTARLAKAAKTVVAIELDEHLALALREEFPNGNVRVENANVLNVEVASYFSQPFVVVANLPYHITSPALRHLLGAGPPFASRLIVMVQAEVADRIAARPGTMSSLAVILQAQARVSIVRQVPAASFYPVPKVDSTVLRLDTLPETDRLIERTEIPSFTNLVHAGFKQPRKTVANSLADGLGVSKAEAIEQLTRVDIDPALRPQALAVPDWARLFRAL